MPRTSPVARALAAALVPLLAFAGALAGADRAEAYPAGPSMNVRWFNAGQADPRWGPTEMYSGSTDPAWLIGRCGCQLSAYTGMIWHHLHVSPNPGSGTPAMGADPFFATTVNDYVWEISHGNGTRTRIPLTDHEERIFSPHYLDLFFRGAEWGGRENWGYVDSSGGDIGCGSLVQPWAMEEVGTPSSSVVPGPDGAPLSFETGPRGIAATVHEGYAPAIIDANLLAGYPTIVARQYPLRDGSWGGHYEVITGYDATLQRYRIHDPASPTGSGSRIIGPEREYAKWLNEVVQTIEVRPSFHRSPHLVVNGTGGPAAGLAAASATATSPTEAIPYDLTAVLPDGSLVGYDPATGELVADERGYRYDGLETGTVDGEDGARNPATRSLVTNGATVGVTRTVVTGTAAGTYDLELFDVDAEGVRTDLGTVGGAIAAGTEVKHEVTYDEAGVVGIAEVTNFTPEPVLEDLEVVAGEPLVLDGSASFDVDGDVVAWAWDLGDGRTAAGEQVTRTYEAPGTYALTLTVTDDQGATRTESVAVEVAPSELDAPALEATTDPAGGWATDAVTVRFDATDDASGVASITTSAAGADEHAEATTPGSHAEVVVDAEGRTTVRGVATDRMGNVSGAELVEVGIDRTGPTAAVLTPGAGRPTSRLAVLGGTAADALAGVEGVEVRLQRADGASWDGTGWVAAEAWLPAEGTHAWSVVDDLPAGADLPDGGYRVQARATDAAGNLGAPSPAVSVAVQAATTGLPVTELDPPADREASAGQDVGDDGRAVGAGRELGLNDPLPVTWAAGGAPTPLPLGGRPGAEAAGRNAAGDAAGWVYDQFARPAAAAWIDGEVVELGSFGGGGSGGSGGSSMAYDIDDAGVAVGSSTYGATARQRAARFVGGVVQLLPDLGGGSSVALASNEAGTVVGYAEPAGGGAERAFVVPAGASAAQVLPSLGVPEDPDVAVSSTAWDVNDAGTIVGTDNGRAVRWVGGDVVDLGEGEALGVDEDGTAVGVFYLADAVHAVLWEGTSRTDLNDLIDAGTGWVLERADGISPDGRYVTGSGTLHGEPRGFVLDLGGSTGGGDGDTTPPTTTATAPGGWSRTAVDVALAATDAGSGVDHVLTNLGTVEGSEGSVTVDAEGTTTVVHAAVDRVGNVETPGTTTVRIDRTPPLASVSGPAPGWAPGPVALTVAGTDAGSGIDHLLVSVDGGPAATVAPGAFTVEGDGEHAVSVLAVDVAGNVGTPVTTTVRIDADGPTVTFLEPEGGATVASGTPVFAHAGDAGSGVARLDLVLVAGGLRQPFANGGFLTAEGPATVEATAVDHAGNRTVAELDVEVETGPPIPEPTGLPPVADAGGPYDVAAGELFTLDGSGSTDPDGDALTHEWLLDSTHLEDGATVALRLAEGTYAATLVVRDGQWTATAHTVVRVGPAEATDTTPPVVTATVSPDPVLLRGPVAATATATDEGGSGLAGPATCGAVSSATVGARTVTCTATDRAGNVGTATATYRVVHGFAGFEQPVDVGVVNVANAGRAIPLKWRVVDGAGQPVLGLTTVSVTSVQVPCAGGSAPSDAVEEYAAGGSGFRSLGDGRYQFNWDTPRSYAGQCRVVRVDTGDGVAHTATFRFR